MAKTHAHKRHHLVKWSVVDTGAYTRRAHAVLAVCAKTHTIGGTPTLANLELVVQMHQNQKINEYVDRYICMCAIYYTDG